MVVRVGSVVRVGAASCNKVPAWDIGPESDLSAGEGRSLWESKVPNKVPQCSTFKQARRQQVGWRRLEF